MSDTSIFPIFNSGAGYGIIVGFGGIFAILMSLTTLALKRYFSEVQDSEMYLTAKRSIKAGLIASSVVSSWTLSATLLTSTTFGYSYGIASTFWYGAGCSVPILTFAVLAIELKRKAPNAHTFLELVKHRYGAPGHIVLAVYSLIYQIFIAVNLLVGGAEVFHLVTGMNKIAVCFLFPLGVCIYTLIGGIKATFLTEWVHTVIIYIIMLVSMFVMYATSDHVGSPGRMWELLKDASEIRPVEGNAGGELLTTRSFYGGLVGLIFLGGGFSATVDSQLFQKAIAADPKSTVAGYLLGSLCWFSIPFCIATTFGLGGAALEHTSLPTYPTPLSAAEINSALVMPYTAYTIMGKGGVVAVLLMVFQAITSAMSSGAVIPSACTLFWKKQSKYAIVLVPIISSLASISTWIGVAYHKHGTVTIATLSDFIPTVAGNMLALTAPIILTPLITYLKPENYDFENFKELQQVDDSSFDIKAQTEGVAIKNAQERTEAELINLQGIEKELYAARNFALGAALFIAISLTM
ncbi:hypothetical protein QQX98_005042 [Neonectria punicea]|uniref:Uncharacterized protein n=1 Tax=Neonectria punicea TaxID=979145 RepID=A0ABR1H808_9HYPO